MEELIVKHLINGRKRVGKAHTYIIKKDSLNQHSQDLEIHDTSPKVPRLKS